MKLCSDEPLYVVAVVSNPARYGRRYQLFNEFCERMKKNKKVFLLTVELQQGRREFATNACVKLRTNHELWHKENLINIGVQHLPSNWKYMAWVDTDLEFQNEKWAEETMEELQTYDIVQMFSHCVDMGPKGEVMQVHIGFMYQYMQGEEWKPAGKLYGSKYFHPGFSWACTKQAYNHMGGVFDMGILGSGDYHMAMALVGMADKTLNPKLHPNYKNAVMNFQDRCERHIKRNVGYVKGTIIHIFHSDKKFRQYGSRWNILTENQFDPLKDIKKDHQDLWQLDDYKFKLRDDIRKYFRARNEDSIDLFQDYTYSKRNWAI